MLKKLINKLFGKKEDKKEEWHEISQPKITRKYNRNNNAKGAFGFQGLKNRRRTY